MGDPSEDAVFVAKIRSHIRRKMALLNLQLGASVAVAIAVVLVNGWNPGSLWIAALVVGLCNAGQGISIARSLPEHVRINRRSPAIVHGINRVSLGTDIAFVSLWIIITTLLVVAALRASGS